jgi:hypothetical protein
MLFYIREAPRSLPCRFLLQDRCSAANGAGTRCKTKSKRYPVLFQVALVMAV